MNFTAIRPEALMKTKQLVGEMLFYLVTRTVGNVLEIVNYQVSIVFVESILLYSQSEPYSLR